MRWRGRSQLPLWDRHKAAIRDRRQHVCPGWEVSGHGCRVMQGLGQNPLPVLCPCTQLPLDCHPERGRSAPRTDTGSTCGSKVQGLCSPELAQDAWVALCLCCSGKVIPGSLPWVSPPPLAAQGSPLLPPKPADQIPMSSRQAGCLTAHLSQLAPFSRILEFSWMKDAMEICNSRAQALVLVSSSAL